MNLHEYQSKALFARYGIPTPGGMLATGPGEAYEIARELGGAVVVKAQTLADGRSMAGGIRVARTADQARLMAEAILGMLIGGQRVHKILIEPLLELRQEFFLGVSNDRAAGVPALMAVAGTTGTGKSRNTGRIVHELVDPLLGLRDYQIRNLIYTLEMPSEMWRPFADIAHKLYRCFDECDATVAEISPLALTKTGSLYALDGKITLDDNALYRHPDLAEMRDLQAEPPESTRARGVGLEYVQLDGQIGCVANGAGLAMATMDVAHDVALKLGIVGGLACFVDIGGGARADKVAAGMNIIASDPRVQAIIFNIFGGITRCDEVARGILQAIPSIPPSLPVIVRLAGTNAKAGRAIIDAAALPNLQSAAGVTEAAEKAFRAARESADGR